MTLMTVPECEHSLAGADAAPFFEDLIRAYRDAQPQIPADAAALIERLLAFSAQAEQRLAEQASRIHELESLSLTDPLTGLLNRRGFQDALTRVLANAQRHGEEGVLAYIDLDSFKAINDRFGHGTGDDILIHVADLLKRNVRGTDYVARLGGDEFAVIFTHAAPPALKAVVDKLKRCVRSSVAHSGGRLITVRASVGCELYGAMTSLHTLLDNADKAMYREKTRRVTRAA